VEEGKRVRAGKKSMVNCWTIITVNGKEFVVEKQFKKDQGPVVQPRPHTSEGGWWMSQRCGA
jgi:hypothetical protein